MERRGKASASRGGREDPFTADALSFEEIRPYLDEMKPGTLFFSDHGRDVSARFIEGNWKHCGIYLGSMNQMQQYWGKDHELVLLLREYFSSEEDYLIFDSSYDYGVAIHSIKELADLSEQSTLRTLLLVETKLGKEEWSRCLLRGMEQLGKEYDYFFVLENDDALYCSEFMYLILQMDRCNVTPSRKILGREFLLPSDLLQSIGKSWGTGGDYTYKGTLSKKEGRLNYDLTQ